MVISVHKTLASFTQGAMLFARGERIDRRRLDAAFDLLNTTSPSAAIYGSLDRARQLMALRGHELIDRTLLLAARARAELREVPGCTCSTKATSHATAQHARSTRSSSCCRSPAPAPTGLRSRPT